MTDRAVINNNAGLIWAVADLLRGDYKQSEYGKVILPLTVLRRLDCVLEPSKDEVLSTKTKFSGRMENLDPLLERAAGDIGFYNTSKLTMSRLLDDPANIADNLRGYIAEFSSAAREILEKFDFETQINRLDSANILYMVVSQFCDIDLHPDAVSNLEMGYLYEELIRRFSELSNETAGEHFTPREVIRLMVSLLFIEDDDLLSKPGTVKTLFDPACGTGGMLSIAEDYLRAHTEDTRLEVFGQELNPETYAVCRSDMMLKGQDASHITLGNSFTDDGYAGRRFDYMLANPPFGVEWKKVQDQVKREHEKLGFDGRFGAGLPRINDGSFLFLQHMISKMKPRSEGGSRLAIVFNGSPLFTGAAGSGESEIRRWILENDWLEAVVALPDQLFYNTGISTYFWIVSNRKSDERKGKVQLLDARSLFTKMKRSLGEKRKEVSDDQIAEIVRLYGKFEAGEYVKVISNEEFGFMRVTVERPLRLRTGQITADTVGAVEGLTELKKLSAETFARLVSTLKSEVPITDSTRGDAIVSDVVKQFRLTAIQAKALRFALSIPDPGANPMLDKNGEPLPDPDLRDTESVPLPAVQVSFEVDVTDRLRSVQYRSAVTRYVEAEVKPFDADAWVDHDKIRIGYEIPVTRHFYKYVPARPLVEIDSEIKALESEIQALLSEVTE